jgi:hypothetical protein
MSRFEVEVGEVAERAVEEGTPDQLLQLGLMYANGRSVPVDMIEAHKWFNLAAMRGNAAARQYREDIASELSKAEIGIAQRRAREWLSRH